jgi:hypothetical protein
MEEIALENDPGRWGASLINVRELLRACLDARGARSVLEVGAHAGELTRELLDWAADHGATVAAIDPEPPEQLLALKRERTDLELIERTSHEALAELTLPDAIVIDGDHNYFTVSEELRLIGESTGDGELPLLLFHDVGWPHARRDSYYVPDRIPEEHRQPIAERGGIAPGEPGLTEGGLPLPWVAEREGGPGNGVLTAIEDFAAKRGGLGVATLPIFFGFGVVWDERADWADAIAAVVAPWVDNPILERLEGNRLYHLAFGHRMWSEVMAAQSDIAQLRAEVEAQAAQLEHQRTLLTAIADSSAFAIAERLSAARHGGRAAISRKQIRETLGDGS